MANTNHNNPTNQAQAQTTKVIIPCRISFANIWEPKIQRFLHYPEE